MSSILTQASAKVEAGGREIRSSIGFGITMLIAGIIGIIPSFELSIERIVLLKNPDAILPCDISAFVACKNAMESWQGSLFGFPNPFFGIAAFSIIITVGVALIAGATFKRWFWLGLWVGTLGGIIIVTFLQIATITDIGKICLWCTMVWTAMIPLFVLTSFASGLRGAFGSGVRRVAERAAAYRWMIVALWYLAVLAALGIRFGPVIFG